MGQREESRVHRLREPTVAVGDALHFENADDPIDVASIKNVFTTTVLMTLIEDGPLDGPIAAADGAAAKESLE